jgi:hypothetical protein
MNDYNNDHSTVEHGSELAVIDVQQLPDTVRTTRAPLTVLAEAQLAAAALLSVLNTKPKTGKRSVTSTASRRRSRATRSSRSATSRASKRRRSRSTALVAKSRAPSRCV